VTEQLVLTDEQLVADAIAAREEAEATEEEASPCRWREAENYAALASRGWSQRKIADECRTNQTTVSYFVRCIERFPRESDRGSFWTAYQEIRSDKAHVSQNAGDSEWFTPPEYIEAAVNVMGRIDLDPASTAEANEVVKASEFFTADQDGLLQKWEGRVWMNPPYARPLIDQFCAKLAESFAAGDVTQACVLVNNATETGWFHALAEVSSAMCFPRQRVRFWHPEKESAPLQGQAVVYLGEHVDPFRWSFLRFGFTVIL
jgi:phage N-6-adenine-methyltransferase